MRTPRRSPDPSFSPGAADAPPAGEAAPDGSRLSNTPELSVSELSGALKKTVEERFGYVKLRGEVSNYRGPHSSGHAYFSLKDDAARIDAVIWRTTFARMRIKPEEGLEVVATGKVTTFPGKSSYQIVIETLEPAGIGALMAMLEERRRKLAAEGLFDAGRKQLLPFLPSSIGVVTSPTGAVIRDILHRIAARFPRPVLVWPVRVQGETSAAEVARAIRGFNALARGGRIAPPQVIIVARGGGSLEDLWGFNDESVVRAAAESLIPLVSAVGHETDWTLLDHAADVRAPTPTGAAEFVVPVRAELSIALDRLGGRHGAAVLRRLDRGRDALRSAARALPSGADLLGAPRQRLDRASAQLPGTLRALSDRRRILLGRLAARLAAQSLEARLARAGQRLEALGARLERAASLGAERRQRRLDAAAQRLATSFTSRLTLAAQQNRVTGERLRNLAARIDHAAARGLERRRQNLQALGQMLGALGYRSVLGRGFALVRNEAGQPLRRPGDAPPGTLLSIDLAEGALRAKVIDGALRAEGIEGALRAEGIDGAKAKPRGKSAKPSPALPRQGTLL
jgi:exodeoxyribonuclease VII large subunit